MRLRCCGLWLISWWKSEVTQYPVTKYFSAFRNRSCLMCISKQVTDNSISSCSLWRPAECVWGIGVYNASGANWRTFSVRSCCIVCVERERLLLLSSLSGNVMNFMCLLHGTDKSFSASPHPLLSPLLLLASLHLLTLYLPISAGKWHYEKSEEEPNNKQADRLSVFLCLCLSQNSTKTDFTGRPSCLSLMG